MKHLRIFLCLSLLLPLCAVGARVKYTINDAWRFSKGAPYNAFQPAADDSAWERVDIPHTWNAQDADDETPGFYRGPAWYRKRIDIPASAAQKQIYLCFEGANQVTRLYVNGHFAGEHVGGYTRFNFDITRFIRFGQLNVLAIQVDNGHNPNIPPLSADFTFFGGIYRDVSLLITDKVHVSPMDKASSGVYLTTPEVSHDRARVELRTLVANTASEARRVRVEHLVLDPEGREVLRSQAEVEVAAGGVAEDLRGGITIAKPRLWDIDSPNLYRVFTRILAMDGTLLDEVSNPLGLRWFSFSPDKGFVLNGRPRKLIGTCRHQDFLGMGWAITDQMHERDVRLIKQMGGNFLRVSHYPQDPVVMEVCDRLGIVTSVEIPVVNAITETQEFIDNSVEMVREMIRQDYNHPSVMIWAYMNEVLLRPPYKGDEVRMAQYYKDVERVAVALEQTVRTEDPTRYTMMAYHNAPKAYAAANLTKIPMIQGWNLYQGWYEPDIRDFERILDRLHTDYPDKVLMVTEYGPGVDPRLHSFSSEQFDFTQEYGLVYHRHYLREMQKRPFVAGSSLWNLNDFYSEPRIDAVPHVNNKGVTGLNRELKDTYLFYQSSLLAAPQLAIGNREWKNRGGADNGSGRCLQPVPVFTNQPSVTLTVNGRKLAAKRPEGGVAIFDVPFVDGQNRLVATAGSQIDVLNVDFRLAKSGDAFDGVNVMLGSHRYFDDRVAGAAWIPEQPYTPGSWGYVGGEVMRRAKTGWLGTDADISGTKNTPIFQTQRVGIEAFRADVPDGVYSVSLYWAELDAAEKREALAYNLGAEGAQRQYQGRRFDVRINGERVLENFSIADEVGFLRPVMRKFEIVVRDGKGIRIDFGKVEGEPVLNAIRIYRNY